MLTIADRTIASPLLLAPLAGYSDLPFRLLCRSYGAGLCVSEMISAEGLVRRQVKTMAMLHSCPDERPVSFQLFGATPEIMAEAAAIASSYRPDFIDINMGCPVKKVTRKGAGAALMADPARAEAIVKAVVKSSTCPVTLKIRSGPDHRTIAAVDFGLMAEANGIAALCIHGRTWAQGFAGEADWAVVSRVKQALAIPVLGNGDVTTHRQALIRIRESGCDGVLIGRAAIGNPWVFSASGRPDTLAELLPAAARHLDLIDTHLGAPERSLGSIKNHLGRYFRGFPGCSGIRQEIHRRRTLADLRGYLQSLVQDPA